MGESCSLTWQHYSTVIDIQYHKHQNICFEYAIHIYLCPLEVYELVRLGVNGSIFFIKI